MGKRILADGSELKETPKAQRKCSPIPCVGGEVMLCDLPSTREDRTENSVAEDLSFTRTQSRQGRISGGRKQRFLGHIWRKNCVNVVLFQLKITTPLKRKRDIISCSAQVIDVVRQSMTDELWTATGNADLSQSDPLPEYESRSSVR